MRHIDKTVQEELRLPFFPQTSVLYDNQEEARCLTRVPNLQSGLLKQPLRQMFPKRRTSLSEPTRQERLMYFEIQKRPGNQNLLLDLQ